MQPLLILLITFLAPLLVCALVTPTVARLAHRAGLVDRVGQDKLTTRALPRLGGVGIFLAFLTGLGLTFVLPVDRTFDPYETSRLTLLTIGASLIFVVMLADDVAGLSPRQKLGWQLAAAALVSLPGLWTERQGILISSFQAPVVGQVDLPLWIALPFTLFWLTGMTNTMNWVDGLDGLASGVTLIACTALFAHTYFQPETSRQFTIALLPLLLGGCVAGFLIFNWHPARIIMGDCGAMFLGFTLASISLIGGAKLATALLALAVPILDVAWMIVARLVQGRSPMQRDTRHLHHRLYELGLSQRQVVLIYYGLCGLGAFLALVLDDSLAKLIALIVAGLLIGSLLLLLARWPTGHRRQPASSPPTTTTASRPRRRP